MNGTKDAPTARRPRRLSRLFALALILVATFVVVRSLAPHTLGETARRKFLAQLQEHYRGYSVSIRRGRFDPEVGLIFEDLRISDLSSSTFRFRSREMVRVERITVVADVHPEKLLDQENPLLTRGIILDGVHANAWLEGDGQISLAKLLPPPCMGPVAPRMEMRRVHLNVVNGQAKTRPVTAELDEVVILNTTRADGAVERSMSFRGSTDFANDLLVRIDTQCGETDLRCAVKGAHLSRDLFDRLPDVWTEPAKHAQELQCICDATLALHQSADGQLNYRLKTTIHDGRFDHPSLPKPISGLRGIVVCDPHGVAIEASQGTFGDAIIRMTGQIDGHRWPCNADLNVSARGLLLDNRIAVSLPLSMQTGWNRLQPLGRIDIIDAKVSHQDLVWKTDASIVCKGVDVRYEKFPYPVENLVGRIEIRDGIATAEAVSGRISGNRMQCAFRLPIKPGITNERSVVIATDGPVPIDRTLLRALSPRGSPTTKLESFVRSLRPQGSIQLATAVFSTDAEGRRTREIDLRVIDGRLRYANFPYPLYNVSGKIEIENELVSLIGLRATNANAGTVLCDGHYRMPVQRTGPGSTGIPEAALSGQSLSHLALNFRATNVPMDDALRSSLPVGTRQVWDAIAPSGVLDDLHVILGQRGSGNPLALDITAKQHDHEQVTSKTLSLRPASLPYRIDITGGTVRYDGSEVTIESIKGRHDASTLSANGRCVQDNNRRWELLLNLHSGSRLHPDAELIAALPLQMREAMRVLQLRGPVSVRGQTRFALPDATHVEPAIQWDLMLQLEGNRIGDVGPVHSIRGELSVEGIRDERGIRAEGDVQIDSMHVYDLQITGIHGPFSIDDDRLHLGGLAIHRNVRPASAENTAQQIPSIRGKLFDGVIDLDGEVVLSSGSFDVGLAIGSAQVPTVLADFGHSDNELTGTFSGQTQLQGNLGTTDLLKGSGAARLTGANLYKLPLIVQVLNLLRIKPTKDVAFSDGEVEFTIFGDSMTFSHLQIWGDLVALQGGGTLDRRRELDLTFNTRVSPQNSFRQLFSPFGQRYALWTIDVRGPLHSLDIQRRAFDGVEDLGRLLFLGMAGQSDANQPSRGRFGSWFSQRPPFSFRRRNR